MPARSVKSFTVILATPTSPTISMNASRMSLRVRTTRKSVLLSVMISPRTLAATMRFATEKCTCGEIPFVRNVSIIPRFLAFVA